jgi:DNA recombination protein RmuC
MEITVFLGVVILALAAAVVFFALKSAGGSGKDDGQLGDISRRIDDITKSINDNNLRANDSLHKQFESSQKLVRDITERMAKFEETNKSVLHATDKLEDLQNILLNPKHRGNFGEFQLKSLLENIFPPNQWQAQYKFKNGDLVDAVLFLKDGVLLPIDSKFSLENYNRMVGEKDKTRKDALAKEVYKDLKGRIDETAKYVRPDENTMDFAFMFVPSEALYYDMFLSTVGADAAQRDLLDYAMYDKRVIVVSPTTFTAYLQTVLYGLRSLQVEQQAKEIQKRVGQLGQHIQKYEEFLAKLGNSLGTTVNHYNNAHKELGKIDKDVVKISGGETSVVPIPLDKPQTD